MAMRGVTASLESHCTRSIPLYVLLTICHTNGFTLASCPLHTTQSKAGSTLMMLSMLGLIIVLPLGLVMRHLMQYEW